MSPATVRAEILKLARLLNVDAAELDYLGDLPADDLRALREQVTEVLFAAQDGALGRLAAASRLLPVGVVATIGEHAFGPSMSARVAALLDPDRAVDMALRLPTSFLADVAVEIDPRRASDLIARIPPSQVGDVTRELMRREEYVTMGRFVGHLGDEGLVAALEVLDDRALLLTAFVLESKGRLDHLVTLLPDERLEGIVDAAAADGLWAEALDLLVTLSDHNRRRLAALDALSADGVLEGIVRTAIEQQLAFELLPLVEALPLDAQRRVARQVQAR